MSAPAVQSQRVAIVTGAAQGIGRAIALQLAEDGLDIALNDLPSQGSLLQELVKEIEAKGRKAISVPGSVTKEEDVKGLVDATVRHFGRLDTMIANAGKGGVVGHVADLDMREWDSMWDVNIRGVLFCYKYAAQQMIKQGFGGRIIGASSVCGLRGFANAGAYCASKAVVISVTQTAALELKEHGITVNAYAPGIVDTPLTRTADVGGRSSDGPGEAIKRVLNLPDATVGVPEDVAATISYLVSPKASFVTGQTISMNGGIAFN